MHDFIGLWQSQSRKSWKRLWDEKEKVGGGVKILRYGEIQELIDTKWEELTEDGIKTIETIIDNVVEKTSLDLLFVMDMTG